MQRFHSDKPQISVRVLRLLASGMMTFSTTIATTILSEIAFSTPGWNYAQPAFAKDGGTQVYETANPAVVSIRTPDSSGSGVILSKDGLVLTNAHVVGSHKTVTVELADQRKVKAAVVAFGDRCQDLALLRLPNQKNLPTIPMAKDASVRPGQQVYVIGYPYGAKSSSLTSGIISQVDSSNGMIQTDAPINPGNSGGPLLNSKGEMIGINTARQAGSDGIGFALSLTEIQRFLEDVAAGRAPEEFQQAIAGKQPVSTLEIKAEGTGVSGKLSDDDSVLCQDGSFFDIYEFEGEVGQLVMIRMFSEELPPYLILLAPDGRQIADYGDNLALIVTRLPVGGNYQLLANSNQGNVTGKYDLNITPLILWREEALQPGDPIAPEDGSLYREYVFQGKADQMVALNAHSNDFDTRLELYAPNGKKIAENDDLASDDTNSQVNVRLPQTGSYRIRVSTSHTGQNGEFVLAVR